jgi:hypothetical protein
MLPAERQKKTVNPSSCRVEEYLIIPRESTCPGPSELPVEITIVVFGTWDMYRSLKEVIKSSSLVELLFERICCKGDYKHWRVWKWRLRPKR